MKEKSLLFILEEERKLVDEIRFRKADMQGILEDMEKSEVNKSAFKERYDNFGKSVVDMEERLVSVRKDMKKYLDFIMRL